VEAVAEALPPAARRSKQLTSAILDRAFSGELAPQDPSDEPASVLLERIRAEREAAKAGAKRRRASERRPGP
jgi:type I restriction enzyme S subunit